MEPVAVLAVHVPTVKFPSFHPIAHNNGNEMDFAKSAIQYFKVY